MRSKAALLSLSIIGASYAAGPAWDRAQFRNDSSTDVPVYLTDRPGHYYAVFGVDSRGAPIASTFGPDLPPL